MIPQNEMGVIVLFAQQAGEIGLEIASIQVAFPDLTVIKDGQEYRIEAEYLASNFILHSHDFSGCDIIVCWENDLTDFKFPIIALSTAKLSLADIRYPHELEREAIHWRYRAIKAEREVEQLKLELIQKQPARIEADFDTRKTQIALLLRAGMNKSQIATQLGLHPSTVGRHVQAMNGKAPSN